MYFVEFKSGGWWKLADGFGSYFDAFRVASNLRKTNSESVRIKEIDENYCETILVDWSREQWIEKGF